jgi:hypothetical protein
MFSLRIGDGYYAIVADGASVDSSVTQRIDKAFADARSLPASRLVLSEPRESVGWTGAVAAKPSRE